MCRERRPEFALLTRHINIPLFKRGAVSAGLEVVHSEPVVVALNAGMPRAGERFNDGEMASRFGVRAQGDVRINHAGKCIVLVDHANGGSGRADGVDCTTFFRAAEAAGGRDGRDGGLVGDDLLLSRSREEGYTVLYFTRVGEMLEFASRVEYDSHAFEDRGRGGVVFKLRAVGDGTSGTVLDSPEGRARPRTTLDRDMVERVERIVSANHPYDSKERLLRVLPSRISAADLDRVLDHLMDSGKISLDEGIIRWTSKSARSGHAGPGKNGEDVNRSILAGTRFETIGAEKSQTETIGEYIVRRANADEPGTYTAEDAKEIDEDMRRLARGEYYTHEEVWKEFGL